MLRESSSGRSRRVPSRSVGIERLESRHMMSGNTKGLPLVSVTVPTQVSRTSDADFMIRLDRPVAAGQSLTVQYATRNIGAAAGRDYVAESKAVTFVPGEAAKLVNIQTLALPAGAANRGLKPQAFALDITRVTDQTGAAVGKIVQKTAVTNIVNEAAGFQIDVSFVGNVSDKTKVAAREAADRWQSIITGDLPSTMVNGVYVDDFTLVVREEMVDGPSNALAYASPTRTDANGQMIVQKRSTSNTAYGGTAVVDIADRDNAQIKDILVHEIGHALGVGPFWRLEYIMPYAKPLGLVKNLMTDNPIYVGRYALAEYRKLVPGAVGVPLEAGGGGGTRGAHWSEAVFGNELMTGYLSPTMPLSRITVGALQDLGYSVNYAKADPYRLPTVIFAAAGSGSQGGLSGGITSRPAGASGSPGSGVTTVSAATPTAAAAGATQTNGTTMRYTRSSTNSGAALMAGIDAPRQLAFSGLASRKV